MQQYHDTIIESDRFTPFILKELSVDARLMELPRGMSITWLGSDYVRRIIRCIQLDWNHRLINGAYATGNQSNIYGNRIHTFKIRVSGQEYLVQDGFMYHINTNRILFMTCYDSFEDRMIGFIDREFDSPRVPILLASMRKHVRKGMQEGRVKGMLYKHVPPGFFSQFKMSFDYDGKGGLVKEATEKARRHMSELR